MNTTQTQILAALAVVALLALVPVATAQGQGIQYQYNEGMASLTTGEIGVKVTAYNQVPHFIWWNATSNETDYHVMFLKLLEANDTDNDGAFDPEIDKLVGAPYLLPSGNWNFSGFETVEEDSVVTEIHFNFTTTETFTLPVPTTTITPGQQPTNFDVTIQIRVHIDTANPHEMKFDLIISGWNWVYDDSILVFQFTITESAHEGDNGTDEPPEFVQEGNEFQFGEGYMEYAEQAQAGDTPVQVAGTSGEGTGDEEGQSVYLAFEYFGEETLEYDPTLGISSTNGDSDGGDGDGIIDGIMESNQLLLIGGGIVVVVVVVAIVKLRR